MRSTWPTTTPGTRRATRPAPAGAPKAKSIGMPCRAAGSVGSSRCSRAANRLVCTYWGGDPDRAFDILIDGAVLATQTVNHDRPGQFLDVEYTIPAELTKARPQ